jgi:Porphobilinogen deaminase, dipyromethane cofactor binding domain
MTRPGRQVRTGLLRRRAGGGSLPFTGVPSNFRDKLCPGQGFLEVAGMATVVRIGTRRSSLALAQAEETRRRLAAAHPALAASGAIEIAVIRTTGDRVEDRPLCEIGVKGLFTKEIEDELLDGSLDLAVHSMKDTPTKLRDGLMIGALLPRDDPRDTLFARDGAFEGAGSLAALKPGLRGRHLQPAPLGAGCCHCARICASCRSAAMSTLVWPSSMPGRSTPPCSP